MKIVSLQAENIKRLRAVEVTPTSNVVQITGRNGQGKTSLLDAIWWALAGQAAIQGQPIRTGENKARIRLDLGEIVVTRKFKRHDDGEVATEITVENAEGVRFGSPQRMLDALLGELSFDPLAFARMTAREQYDTLRRFVPDVDFDGIEAATKADFDRRTAVNREAKEARAQAAGIHVLPDAPKEAVDEQAIVAEMAKASEHNAGVARREADRQAQLDRIAKVEAELQRLIAEQHLLRDALVAAPPVGTPIDTAALQERAAAAHRANEAYQDRKRRDELNAKADEAERKSAALTAGMQERERQKQQAIAAAAMPVPDLTFGDGEVLKAGVPFEQASDAEKLRASVAIAMAMNPKLRVIRIRDGSLLDAASLALVSEMAKDQDCQVWIERVADDRSVGFVIEDGSVVAAPDPLQPSAAERDAEDRRGDEAMRLGMEQAAAEHEGAP